MSAWWRAQGSVAGAVTAALTAGLIALVIYSLNSAGWVTESWRYADGLALGALCGAGLARSRFRGRLAVSYSLVIGLLFALEAAGRVWPDWAALAGPAGLSGLSVRALTLSDQIRGWVQTWAAGGVIPDQAVFILVMHCGLWQVGAWLAWALLRRRAALAGLLPIGGVLALNAQLAARPDSELALGLTLSAALMAHTAYVHARQTWEERGVDYAEAIGQDWGLAQIPVTLVIGLLVLGAPWVGTPRGWRALGTLFRPASQQTADTVSRLFAGVKPPAGAAEAFTAQTPDLSRLARPLPEGPRTVMWVTVSDPAPRPLPAGGPAVTDRPHYWRSQVYSAYTGAGWEPAAQAGADDSAKPSAPPAGRYALTQQFQIAAAHGVELFAVNVPVTATGAARIVPRPADLDAGLSGDTSTYTVTSWATAVSGEQLARAPAEYPAAIRAAYLPLPADLPQRVRALAARLTAGAATPYASARRIQDYLRATYAYQLDPPAPPAGRDVVDYFLFEAPGGFCTYYASAMAVLLRARGVPARVAAGFAMGEFDAGRGAWRVAEADSHAWVEVYFPGYGWVEFEPTPSQARRDYGGALEPAPPPAALEPQPLAAAAAPWPAWLALLGGLLLIVGAGWWQQRRATRGLDPAGALYWRMRAALALAGLTAPASATPDEFLTASAPALAGRPRLWAALSAATRLYVERCYGGRNISAEAVRGAAGHWDQARGEWLRLWWRRQLSQRRRTSPPAA